MNGSESPTDLPRTREVFQLDADFIAEIQKALCRDYDEESKTKSNLSSTQVWSACMAYVEAGLTDRPEMQITHRAQRAMVKFGLKNKQMAEDSLSSLDHAIQSKQLRDLAVAMGKFFTANMDTSEEASAFSSKAAIDVEGVLAGHGV